MGTLSVDDLEDAIYVAKCQADARQFSAEKFDELNAELARLRALSEFAERIIGMAHRHNTRSHSTERAVYFTGVDCRDLVRRYESGLPLEDGNDGDRQRQELRRDDVHAV